MKFLSSTAGLPAVRLQAAQRLEIWLTNQKLLRPATDLLLSICINCNPEVQSDTDTINALLRLRLKVPVCFDFLFSGIVKTNSL